MEAKAKRVCNFHHNTMHAFLELCGAMGYENPSQLKPRDIVSRYDAGYRYFDEIHQTLQPNQLLDSTAPTSYLESWTRAEPDRF